MINFKLIAPDPLIWYSPNSNIIEIVESTHDVTTLGVDMSGYAPMDLCQDVKISVGSKYRLSFSLYSFTFKTMIGKAWINKVQVSEVFIPSKFSFGNSTHIFYASQQFNTFCLNETHAGAPGNIGGIIDNISLLLEE